MQQQKQVFFIRNRKLRIQHMERAKIILQAQKHLVPGAFLVKYSPDMFYSSLFPIEQFLSYAPTHRSTVFCKHSMHKNEVSTVFCRHSIHKNEVSTVFCRHSIHKNEVCITLLNSIMIAENDLIDNYAKDGGPGEV